MFYDAVVVGSGISGAIIANELSRAGTAGLLWPAIGASPPGAKAPGYGSWAGPPRIPAEGIAW